jgi:hypothetical protein
MANDALQSAASKSVMEGHGNRDCCSLGFQLHNAMAAVLSDGDESLLFKNLADFNAGKNPYLPNRHLNLRDEDLASESADNFRLRRGCEEQRQCLNEIGAGFFDGRALAGDVQLGA